jgi:hypothetical protein
MSGDESSGRCRGRALLGIGLSVGVVVGFAVGSVIALRLGHDAADTMRSLFDRVSGRNNQVNFELLLQ